MRAVMLVPWAIPTVVAAQMWKWMLDDTFGVINDAGVRLHILSHSHAWISEPSTALGAVCAVDIWKTTPFVALLLLAGPAGDSAGPLRGRRSRRRERAPAVLEDHAAAPASRRSSSR